jgi:hypothetical protein
MQNFEPASEFKAIAINVCLNRKYKSQENFKKQHRVPFCSIELNSEPHKITNVSE